MILIWLSDIITLYVDIEAGALFCFFFFKSLFCLHSCTKGIAPRSSSRPWLPSSRTICLFGSWWLLLPAWFAVTLKVLSPESPPLTGMRTTITKPSWASAVKGGRAATSMTTAQVSHPDVREWISQDIRSGHFSRIILLVKYQKSFCGQNCNSNSTQWLTHQKDGWLDLCCSH